MNRSLPIWITKLDNEDIEFIKNFVLHSGSFKNLAKYYDVSYPTIKSKTNNVIEKIKMFDLQQEDSFISLIKSMSLDDKISLEDAKILIKYYMDEKENYDE
ncbi:DUF2089 family protein [Virgibacillus pantothenticus]|uniref:DUF2089 family protein n=1 Tax=Virgibacillus pantothenticus TaxID=1473 RepID=UPI0009857B17|nr:DUF2089 family protein [Virgibacillus pantothenticus]